MAAIRNPESGDTYILSHEVMKKLAKRGHEMTLFTSRFKACQLNEI
jgi:hypothetical protein